MKSHRLLKIPTLLVTFCALATSAHAADKKAPPPKPANQYAAFETHPDEHVTVAAEPCNDPEQCSFFRLQYVQHGFIPIRVIITNDGDTALSLDEVRMQFISANHDVIPAALPDDINRRLFSTKSAQGTKVPLVPLTIHHAPVDKKITQDDDDFGFQGTTVNPHSTLAGYLFYDVRGLDDPPLKGAEFYVKMIHTLDGKKELFAFSIPLNKWLASSHTAAATTKSEVQKN
ncbi:MAG TPA: hypothetical protein VIX90_16155 [Edaphobacter sp.]